MGITRVTIVVFWVSNLLTKSPDPPNRVLGLPFMSYSRGYIEGFMFIHSKGYPTVTG